MKESGTEKKWILFRKAEQPDIALESAGTEEKSVLGKILSVIRILCLALWRLRGVIMAIPVVLVSLRLAAYNSEHLPLLVGINLQTNGEFSGYISRQSAVLWPLIITGACLVMTFLSRKNLYPWLISIFSLTIPLLLLITNMYPA